MSIQELPTDPDRLQSLIDQDLLELQPPAARNDQRVRPGAPRRVAQSSREKRRAAYSRIQALYKSSRTSCARLVLAGKWQEVAPTLSLREQVAFWAPLLETSSVPDGRAPPVEGPPEWDIVAPITTAEVARHLQSLKDGAPGPDNIKRSDVRKLGSESLACRFNVWLLTGIAPEAFRHGVTVLIPKTSEGAEPRDYRPITLGPVLCRLFHRILAERIERHYRICGTQKAFRKGDGIGENTYLLRNVIADRKARNQSTNVAFLDVSKAFDSVSHESIFLAAASAGIPDPIVKYIKSVYTRSQTQLRVNVTLSREISVNRGVRQGDPLSPMLFNSVIDLALRKIDDAIGVGLGSNKLSCLAFAHDLVLLASTPKGLQRQFNNIERALGLSGLKLNVNKSATIRLDVHGKRQIWCCNPSAFLRGQDGQLVKAMSITDGYKYLGNSVSAGDTLGSTVQDLQRDRHDRVNKYLTATLGKTGYTTRVEPATPTPAGVRYPDLIAWKGDNCVVIDTTIVADNFDPDGAHERKVVYYDKPAIRTWCAEVSGVPSDKVKVSACVLTWRGVPSTRSVRELKAYGVSKANWGLMSVKTLEGGVEICAHYGKSTSGFGG